jgi:hypothetical protein
VLSSVLPLSVFTRAEGRFIGPDSCDYLYDNHTYDISRHPIIGKK